MKRECKIWIPAVAFSICLATPSSASGDFPRASCKTWNGTVAAISGIDTRNARMTGMITRADVQEYCDRDAGGETVQYGGKLTIAQCVARYYRKLRRVKLLARADCARATVEFHDGDRVERLQLPAEDASCASGGVPLVQQFIKLCPTRARELKMNDP